MRSIVQAAWILGVAFGNLIVIAVAEARFIPRQVIIKNKKLKEGL